MSYNRGCCREIFVHGRLLLQKLCKWVEKVDVVEGESLLPGPWLALEYSTLQEGKDLRKKNSINTLITAVVRVNIIRAL
jgi:hypothetical protein